VHLNTKFTKLALAAAAPLILVGTVVLPGGSAFAKKAAPNPATCTISTSVTFSPSLSVTGTLSSKGATGATNVSSTYTCTSATGPATVTSSFHVATVAAKPGKDTAAITAGDNPKDYYLGLCGTFTSSAAKDLGKAVKNLAIAGGKLTGAKASSGAVGSDPEGFIVTGTVVGGTYPTAKNGADIKAGLTNDANNTNVIGGCQSGPASQLDIDSSQSSAVI